MDAFSRLMGQSHKLAADKPGPDADDVNGVISIVSPIRRRDNVPCADLGIFFFYLFQILQIGAGDDALVFHLVLLHQPAHLLGKPAFGPRILDLNIQVQTPFGVLHHFLQRWDLLSFVLFGKPQARVQAFDLLICHIFNIPVYACYAAYVLVVAHHCHPVFCLLHVDLRPVRHLLHRCPKRRHGIFRSRA